MAWIYNQSFNYQAQKWQTLSRDNWSSGMPLLPCEGLSVPSAALPDRTCSRPVSLEETAQVRRVTTNTNGEFLPVK